MNVTFIGKCPSDYLCNSKQAGTLFLPLTNESDWGRGLRAFIYFLAMIWFFMGVAIGADLFMCAIETITSKTKRIKVARQDDGGKGFEEVEVRVWNDTVANLTLMALGSSAPEILLSIIEIVFNNFKAGELGPGTIVGSASFNLFVIIAVCVISVPKGEIRTIKAFSVFGITAFFSIFAYVWLYLVLAVITPNVMDVWEAVLTLLMFPILVILSYVADQNFCGRKIDSNRKHEDIELNEADVLKEDVLKKYYPELVTFMQEVTANPKLTEEEAAKLIAMKIESNKKKNYGYYRVGALRQIGGSKKVGPTITNKLQVVYEDMSEGDITSGASIVDIDSPEPRTKVEFAATTCSVLESDKVAKLGVVRKGNVKSAVTVRYETIDGTAESGTDYIAKKELLHFAPNETHKYIDIIIIDDNEWEPDETFFVKLLSDVQDKNVEIGKHSIAEITIINDDEPGEVSFGKPSVIVKESCGKCEIKVDRVNGADGKIAVTWTTKDQTAFHGKDYIGGEGELTFDHGETEKLLEIEIIDDHTFEKDESFIIELSNPTAGSRLGRVKRTVVTVVNDDDYRKMFDRVVGLAHLNLHKFSLGTDTWGQQFKEAMTVNGGDVENATGGDYVMHFLTFFWKILFAFVPPCSWAGGWLAFGCCLALIGIMTALIGDIASIFGCLIGLTKEVTAFTFVALGTSLPDLFASKAAAVNEKYADASIINVTGSNSVNVFLGLGLPWVIASIYHAAKGTVFSTPAGSLAVNVVAYTICAIIALTLLILRRFLPVFGKGELGGNFPLKIVCAVILVTLWFLYVLISALHSYKKISF